MWASIVAIPSTASNSKEGMVSQCKYLEALFLKIRFPANQSLPNKTTDIVSCSAYQGQRYEKFPLRAALKAGERSNLSLSHLLKTKLYKMNKMVSLRTFIISDC